MAWDAKPSSWISSWSEDATTVSFDLADLTQTLTAAEADATSGDWRDCFFSLLSHTYQYIQGLASADRPTMLTITKSGSYDSTNNRTVHTFSVTFYTDESAATSDVAAES